MDEWMNMCVALKAAHFINGGIGGILCRKDNFFSQITLLYIIYLKSGVFSYGGFVKWKKFSNFVT